MNRNELRKIMPHREPMLLVDEVEISERGTALGKYTVTGDEFFVQGHFPNNPIVPGVILCEMMAQTSCVLIDNKLAGANAYLTGLDKFKFRQKVHPGDTVIFECKIIRSKIGFYFVKGEGRVNGKLAVSGEFSFLVDKGD